MTDIGKLYFKAAMRVEVREFSDSDQDGIRWAGEWHEFTASCVLGEAIDWSGGFGTYTIPPGTDTGWAVIAFWLIDASGEPTQALVRSVGPYIVSEKPFTVEVTG